MQKLKLCPCGKRIPFTSTCECHKERVRQSNKDYLKRHGDAAKVLTTAKWSKKRKMIILRDKGHCQRCLIKYNFINADTLQVHHIKPRIEFPELIFEDSNLITLCKRCNLQLGSKPELDFEWEQPDQTFSL
jgi:5-methylcytosine-specific restriction endonuclease McrA